jgi:hypothetical protein
MLFYSVDYIKYKIAIRLCFIVLLIIFAYLGLAQSKSIKRDVKVNVQHTIADALKSRSEQLNALASKWRSKTRQLNKLEKMLSCVPDNVRMQKIELNHKIFSLLWQDATHNNDLNAKCWHALGVNITSLQRSLDNTVSVDGRWNV